MKKTIHIILTAVISFLAMSCMKDGETLIASLEGDGTQIGTADSDIVLTSENSSALALTIWWDRLGNATLSNPNAQMTDDVVVYAIQFSLSEDFSTYSEQSVSSDATNIQFTVGTLNNILYNLNAEGEVATTVYIRMCTSLGTNTDTATYGNTITITVTPYTVDMSKVRLVGVNSAWGEEVSIPVSSDDENVYSGFTHIPSGWWNFFFVEGNGTIYGSHTDSSDNPFPLEQKTDMSSWNAWFPNPSGCYYVTLNTTGLWWECTSVSSMTLTPSGADELSMTYSSTNEAWYLVFTTTSDNQTIQVDYTGTVYNRSYGQNSEQNASASIVAGAGTSGTISSAASGTATGITAGTAGTYTLIIRTSEMTWELHEGEVDIDTGEVINWPSDPDYTAATSDNLYIYDLGSDGTPSAAAGILAKTGESGVYAGFFYMTSGYSFKLGDNETPASATVTYGATPSDTEGANNRLFCGSSMRSIQWTGSASYVYITVNTNERSWSYTEVTSVMISGNFNNWSISENPMTFSSTDKTWSANITPGASWGTDGIQFLINGKWSHSYAPASGGVLNSSSTALIPDVEITAGATYTVTIDLGAMTWKIEEYVASAYPQTLYAIYVWNNTCWPVADASILQSTESGKYIGFISTGTSWDDEYSHWLFCNKSFNDITPGTVTDETIYGNTTDGELLVKSMYNSDTSTGGDGIWACWPGSLGLTLLNIDLTAMTFSKTFLGANIYATINGTDVQMSFDTSTLTWTCSTEIEASCTVTFKLDSAGNYTYGSTDGALSGTLTSGGSAITVEAAGTYTISVDLRNYSNLTYSIAQ